MSSTFRVAARHTLKQEFYNLGPITSDNISSLSLVSAQASVGGGLAVSGNVNQSASVNQVAGISSGIDIEGGDGTAAEAIIVNDGELVVTNASSLVILSTQQTVGGNIAFGGSVNQSASVEQVAGIWTRSPSTMTAVTGLRNTASPPSS